MTVADEKADSRVIARLDEEERALLRHARTVTGQTTSGVIKAALRLYAETLPSKTPLEIFEELGVLGAASGPVDLSETYKSRIDYSGKRGKRAR